MFNFDFLKIALIISIALSSITCTFIQKTKSILKSKEYIAIYSLIVNVVISIFFCKTFTDIDLPNSLWIGIFSFLGADSIYKTLEGKLTSYTDLINSKSVVINSDNIINKEDE